MIRLFILLCLFINFHSEAQDFPHLILHFDVNKTLIASDQTENKSMEDVICELLSRKYSACWDDTVAEPMTFDAYVKTVLLPGHEHDAQLKMDRLFHLIHFIDFLRDHNHPLYPAVLTEFDLVLESLKEMEGNIFPSFYHLISDLDQKGITYTLYLRSFGKEVFEVKNEINTSCKNLFQIDGTFQKGVLHIDGISPLNEPQKIYDFFYSKKHAAIRDDWKYWMDGEMDAKYGKLFYIDPTNTDVLPIFFDDNIKTDSSEKNIIASIDLQTGKTIPIPLLLQTRQLVAVDTLKAILNKRYYIEYVEEALQMHQLRIENLKNQNKN